MFHMYTPCDVESALYIHEETIGYGASKKLPISSSDIVNQMILREGHGLVKMKTSEYISYCIRL